MSEWPENLAQAKAKIAQEEKKREKARREREKAERIRAEERMRLAYRLLNGPPNSAMGAAERIVCKPINRQAAMLMRKASYHSQPPRTEVNETRKPRKKTKSVSKQEILNVPGHNDQALAPTTCIFGDFELIGKRNAKGETVFPVEDVQKMLLAMAKDLPEVADKILPRAKDARAAVNELTEGLGADIENFKLDCSRCIEDIRQSRFSIVAETAIMSKSLREIRQFFFGSDYQQEIERLRDFCDLCERLQKLKADGTLDAVSDTMIRLAVGGSNEV